jgi:hypothetical protein
MALELELEGEHVQLIRVIERALDARQMETGRVLRINVYGAIAAISDDLSHEERTRQAPMRQIDPKDHHYDGSRLRRLPETRK